MVLELVALHLSAFSKTIETRWLCQPNPQSFSDCVWPPKPERPSSRQTPECNAKLEKIATPATLPPKSGPQAASRFEGPPPQSLQLDCSLKKRRLAPLSNTRLAFNRGPNRTRGHLQLSKSLLLYHTKARRTTLTGNSCEFTLSRVATLFCRSD